MGENIHEGISSNCECACCCATLSIAFFMSQGDLAYCEECGGAYIIASRYPLKLQPSRERQMNTPWLDGSSFI
jgi:hypothetical protein